MVGAVHVGLRRIFQMVLNDKNINNQWLNQFLLLGKRHLRFFAITGIASAPSDALLVFLLHGDRVAKRRTEIETLLAKVMLGLTDIEPGFFKMVAETCEIEDGEDLQNSSILCGHVSLGYYDAHTLAEARDYPWKLCDEPVRAQLDELAALPEEKVLKLDTTTVRIRDLYTTNYEEEAENGVRHLANVPFSSGDTEKHGASGSLVVKTHESYGPSMALARTQFHAFGPLVKERVMTKEERRLERAKQDLVKNRKKRPDQIHGAQAYFHAREKAAREKNGGKLTQKERQDIFRTSSKGFIKLSAKDQEFYDEQAKTALQPKAREKKDAKTTELTRKISPNQNIVDKQKLEDAKSVRLVNCRLTPAQLDTLGAAFENKTIMPPSVVEERRKEALRGAPRPPKDEQQRMAKIRIDEDFSHPPQPNYVLLVALNRGVMKNVAIQLKDGTWFVFLYASQLSGREYISFLPIKRLQVEEPGVPLSVAARRPEYSPTPTFREAHERIYKFGDYKVSSVFPDDPPERMVALKGCHFFRGNRVASAEVAVPFDEFLELLPIQSRPRQARAPKEDDSESGSDDDKWYELMEKTPGLAKDKIFTNMLPKKKRKPPEYEDSEDEAPAELAFNQDWLDELSDEMQNQRGARREEFGDGVGEAFGSLPYPGPKDDPEASYYMGKAKNKDARMMCTRAKEQKPFSAKYRTHTPELAGVLAREWSNKTNWMYGVWTGHGGKMTAQDFQTEVLKYEESTEFQEMVQTELSSETLARVIQLKEVFLPEKTVPPEEKEEEEKEEEEEEKEESPSSSNSSGGSSSSDSERDVEMKQ